MIFSEKQNLRMLSKKSKNHTYNIVYQRQKFHFYATLTHTQSTPQYLCYNDLSEYIYHRNIILSRAVLDFFIKNILYLFNFYLKTQQKNAAAGNMLCGSVCFYLD